MIRYIGMHQRHIASRGLALPAIVHNFGAVNALLLLGMGLTTLKDPSFNPQLSPWQTSVIEQSESLGLWREIVFLASYAAFGCTPMPGLGLSLTALGGALYGSKTGIAMNLLGHSVALASGFYASRLLSQKIPRLSQWLQPYQSRFKNIQLFEIVLARMVPMPFSTMNFGFGLSPVSFKRYYAASMLQLTVFVSGVSYLFGSWLNASGLHEDQTLPAWARWLVPGSFLLNGLLINAFKLSAPRQTPPTDV